MGDVGKEALTSESVAVDAVPEREPPIKVLPVDVDELLNKLAAAEDEAREAKAAYERLRVSSMGDVDRLEDMLWRTADPIADNENGAYGHARDLLPADVRAWYEARVKANDEHNAALRASALAKLTSEEREALGVG